MNWWRRLLKRGEMERQFFECFPGIKDVLEIGSCECGRTQHLSRQARSVIGIEGRGSNITRGAWIRRLLHLDNVNVFQANVEKGLPPFAVDAIYCVGVLYHLPRPWELLRAMAALSDNLFLWTHITQTPSEQHDGLDFQRQPEDVSQPLAGLTPYSLWGTKDAVLTMLSRCGYDAVRVLNEERHQKDLLPAIPRSDPIA